MASSGNGGTDEWNGRIGEWRNGGMAEWRKGGMAEWRNGVMVDWWLGYELNLHDLFTVHTDTDDDDDTL